jgi:adenylyltransferase/sulfurtransferase
MQETPLFFSPYERQTILPQVGVQGQHTLHGSRVLVAGADGLGCPVLQYLAAAGVGTIGIADYDVVSLHNLHRQVLYSTADVGLPKAAAAAQKLEALNPHKISIRCLPKG